MPNPLAHRKTCPRIIASLDLVRGAIASEAARRAGRSPAQVVELVRLVSAEDVDLFATLVAADIDGDVVIQAAAIVTGMPAAPRLLLRNPAPPADVDAVGIRDAGGVPIGTVQGRTWIAFSDPEAARAAVFSDDVVVCLAINADLRHARERFATLHPDTAGGDTLAMPAVTPEAIEQWRRQNAIAGPATEVHVQPPAVVRRKHDEDEEDLFDQSGGVTRATTSALANGTSVEVLQTVPGVESPPSAAHADDAVAGLLTPEKLRLLRMAQLGRLRRFRYERILGSGGMATVYLARDGDAPTVPVAVKVLDPQLHDDDVAVGRFRRELRTLKALHHRRIVAPIDGDAEDNGGVLWLSCRYLDGGSLMELIERGGALPAVAALPIVAAVLEGLVYAHSHGVVHRDLKPHNVLLDHDGSICIADFGVAKAVGDAPLTRAGARYGTPAYMSPEQATGAVVDERSDLFSTGVLLYHLVSGQNPFARPSAAETMAAVARADVPPLPPVVRLPAVAAHLLEGLLARAPDARPPDAAAALRALTPLLARLPSVDVVVRRLLADPRAFAGVGFVDIDANDSTVAESVGGSDDDHSAFGAVAGMKATMELPLSAVERLALQDHTIGDADRTDDGNDDDNALAERSAEGDDVDEAAGRGLAAIIGFLVAGLIGLAVLLLWWFAHRG